MATTGKHLVFGYGTLKTGQPNHGLLTNPSVGSALLVGRGRTDEKWPLVIATSLNIPFLLHVPGTGYNVWGEVYDVDDEVLSYLDAFEGYPKFYDRINIPVTLENGRKITACAYFFRDHKPEMLKLPFHEEYNSYGSHGMPYAERSNTRSTSILFISIEIMCTSIKQMLFVYGTLKNGQPNYRYMLDKATGTASFIGKARIDQRFPLVIGSKYNIPFLLNVPGTGYGEVYEIDDKKLTFLDDFEGYPELYDRKLQSVTLDNGKKMKALTYVYKGDQSDFLQLPFIENYDSFGSHGRPYVVRLDTSENCKTPEDLK